MANTTYNGWTNYETWRINLEIFDSVDLSYFGFDEESIEPYDLKDILQEYAEELVFLDCRLDERRPSSLMEDYARAFLSDVNWYEIAEHMIKNKIEEDKETT